MKNDITTLPMES